MTCSKTATLPSHETLRVLRDELLLAAERTGVEMAVAEALLAQAVVMCQACSERQEKTKQLLGQIDAELGTVIEGEDDIW